MSRLIKDIRLIGLSLLLAVTVLPWARAAGENLTGRLLIAAPALSDSNFARTIIYLVRHDAGGALGLVVNEPLGQVPLAKLLEKVGLQTPAADRPPPKGEVLLHYGGPVQPRVPFILHSTDVMLDGSVKLGPQVAFGGSPAVTSLADGATPDRLVLTLGYAGWAPGQLEGEIQRGSWYLADWNESLVFGSDHAAKWDRSIALYGPEL